MKIKNELSAQEELLKSLSSAFRNYESEMMSQKIKQAWAIRKAKNKEKKICSNTSK